MAFVSKFKAFLETVAFLIVGIITFPIVFVILWVDGYFEKD